jgi:hypothetical protein
MRTVFLLTIGDGSDGDEWGLLSIHATNDSALKAKEQYESPRYHKDGTIYYYCCNIEEWDVEE